MFIVSEMVKAARKDANLTLEQLAKKAGTKKSYISKIENGKGNTQLLTLIWIFEQGLNRRIGLTFL
jgi:transcriptional regulator with XRE-family HTH domain